MTRIVTVDIFTSLWDRSRRRLQTEEEWRSWDHPVPLCRLLEGKVSDRKARLFECACLRRLWDWLGDERRRSPIELLERDAAGSAMPEDVIAAGLVLREARWAATCVMGGMWNQSFHEWENAATDAWSTAKRTCEAMDIAAGRLVRVAAGLEDDRPDDEQRLPEERAQCHLLRCIFPSPFHPPPGIDRSVRAWRDRCVVSLAASAYEERELPSGILDASRLAILADALEDAGCNESEVLAHLRGPGPHVRGCFALDAVLGKS
jgi:hypothetical protein